MMKTTYFAATSLDGYIADENNSLDWLFKYGPPEEGIVDVFLDGVGAIAMGSHTYEWILEHNQGPWAYKVPCFVFTSRQLPLVKEADIRFVSGDVKPVHQELVAIAGQKNVWIMGGGELAGKFYDAKLLNEIQIMIVSVTLAGGFQLFPRKTEKPLQLKEVKQIGKACVELTYQIEY